MSAFEKHYKSFTKEIEILSRRHGRSSIFDDFLTLSLCSLHQINLSSKLQEKDDENEVIYFETIKPYSKDELLVFGKLLGILQACVYDQPYSDLIGEYFTNHITRGQNGQYFTPDPVCEMMARFHGAGHQTTGKRVYDPACGSGRLLLNFAKFAPDNYFYANDISYTCAKMSALNFMLNGLRGEVAWMNSLSMEFNSAWKINTPTLGVLPIDKKLSEIWYDASNKEVKKPNTVHPEERTIILGDQLSLF